ncbi:MAG: hypothetical protein RLZZ58_1811 [Pseudomonadota bacterium]|jgi:hypothetical protein
MTEADMVTAMRAIVWILSDDDRAGRLLSLTGLDPGTLRAGLDDPDTLAAVITFLAGHEPDLVACAAALEMPVAELAAVGQRLEPYDID